MLFTRAQGRTVMDLATAQTVGTVEACTVAPSPARLAGLRLKTRGRGHHTLSWEDVQSFGPDEVTVEGADRIRDEKDIDPSHHAHAVHDPIGKTVLTDTGVRKGTVTDIDFDEQSGSILHLMTPDEQIPGDALVGVGSYAVVVTAPK
ncbi:PRC-barrel domain-containing protein [Streptomyces spinoverrucosus]|uniref:PRC-barrel domain-containing protein n=1 Tax=Streptomyces spinoverrucosus TaxID=284043 RepID=UPI0018C41318|nr:PRC-barrel domain-containing protein [Streptomyces spinoverrucosus]MBG0851512.1 PRC-barrel domain-containing protein [Streptomyces spinoverrucosus]